jgi:hypothetical protein
MGAMSNADRCYECEAETRVGGVLVLGWDADLPGTALLAATCSLDCLARWATQDQHDRYHLMLAATEAASE